MVERPIYLDAHATTPLDPRVLEAMLPCFTRTFGNASSRQHAYGWEAEALVGRAREQVAALIGASPEEIVFTSGATESNNLAILGTAGMRPGQAGHVITSAIEHKAVLDPCTRLACEGWQLTVLPVEDEGIIDVEAARAALTEQTALVSVMAANNEIGTLQPIAELGKLCRKRGVVLHCDAAQASAWERLDVEELGVSLMSLSAHKMHGPKGVGVLYVRRRRPRARLAPLMEGGGHERGLRPGTLNVPGIVGMGMAAELAAAGRAPAAARVAALRDRLLELLREGAEGVLVNGSLTRRLPNNLNVSFRGLEDDRLIGGLRGVAVSSGAACASVAREPSHVLAAIGRTRAQAEGSLRFGLHRFTTEADIEEAARLVIEKVRELRAEGSAAG